MDEKESEDELEKKKRAPKKQSVYLKEDEDSIIDFTSPSANRNITSKYKVSYCVYLSESV